MSLTFIWAEQALARVDTRDWVGSLGDLAKRGSLVPPGASNSNMLNASLDLCNAAMLRKSRC